MSRLLRALAAGVLVLSMASGTAAQSADGHRASTAFGEATLPVRPHVAHEPVPLEARVTLQDGPWVEDVHVVMLAFNVLADAVTVRFVNVTTADGAQVPNDARELDSAQPKRFLLPEDLPLEEELVLKATVSATSRGQYHVGVLVIAFDQDWQPLRAADGNRTELYAYTLVKSTGTPTGLLEPPFQGSGNPVPVPAALFLVAVAVAALTRRRPRSSTP